MKILNPIMIAPDIVEDVSLVSLKKEKVNK